MIREVNPEAQTMRERNLAHDSFPSALKRLFLSSATSLVAAGTHGKTTCSALIAHTLNQAGLDPGFLVGGIPLNFNESFRVSGRAHYPFVVEGDEYDTAYFDKKPKFMHYKPNFLLITSIEFDHGDIYRDLDAVIDAFSELLAARTSSDSVVVNHHDDNIKSALLRASTKAKVVTYGEGGDYDTINNDFDHRGISFTVRYKKSPLGSLNIPLFGRHNAANALGSYALLHCFGLSHEAIHAGFSSFLGVKRRLEERSAREGIIKIDDFAHHPTAVRETIIAAKQKYPKNRLWVLFEPRSATSCTKVFENAYIDAFLGADRVTFAPVGRALAKEQMLDTDLIALALTKKGIPA
ncbi:MAG TPA: Mur ligase family protein, partial [Myxococcota bacterium]|nr:Mur ligase family protein [Myxococcota bacterium]